MFGSPPHPRGSTLAGRAPVAQHLVSPAPAGINPSHVPLAPGCNSLPRTRGDQPRAAVDLGVHAPSPPHPRGSTPLAPTGKRGVPVSPAPAGINPTKMRCPSGAPRLPRTRGDQPQHQVGAVIVDGSPPHPRGSTLTTAFTDRYGVVSPAPAGINPTTAVVRRSARSLPRTRGDQPNPRIIATIAASSPPHPRGSTPVDELTARLECVSPAPAGINPKRARHPGRDRRLPRTRGDQPWSRASCRAPRKSPPHPRGSTHLPRRDDHLPRVSPAPAGINPRRRARGVRRNCLPRTRGDQPTTRRICRGRLSSPPHPRGSTRRLRPAFECLVVSPAPAGINPWSSRGDRGFASLPRTRGDQPGRPMTPLVTFRSPPHPRGSTPDRGTVLRGGAVSPAPAGINLRSR